MADDLGIYSEVPFLDRLQSTLAIVLATLFAKPRALQIGNVLWLVVTVGIVGHEAMLLSPRTGIRVLIVVVLLVIFFIWGLLLESGPLPWALRLAMGPPVFGELGGAPRRTFMTVCKCASQIKFRFNTGDLELVKHFGKLDRDITEFSLRSIYHTYVTQRQPDKLPDFDKNWAEVWKEKILNFRMFVGPKQVTFGELMVDENAAARIEPVRLGVVSMVVAPIMKMVQLAMAVLLALYLDGKVNLLTLAQTGLFLGLILCLVLFNYHAHQSAEIPVFDLQLVPDLPDDIRQRLQEFKGRTLRPLKVIVSNRYLGLIQGYFSVMLATFTFINAITWLVMVLAALIFVRFLHPPGAVQAFHWYRDFSLGLMLIPVVLLASYNLMFQLLRSFKLILTPIIIVILTAFLPYAFNYLAGGQVDLKEIHNTYLAIGTSLVTGLTAAITSQVKKTMAGSKGDGEDEDEGKDETAKKTGAA